MPDDLSTNRGLEALGVDLAGAREATTGLLGLDAAFGLVVDFADFLRGLGAAATLAFFLGA